LTLQNVLPTKILAKAFFYITDIRKQAEYMALRRVRQSGEGVTTVIEYYFDESLLKDKTLKVRQFQKPSEAWARFVLDNRQTEGFTHNYDVVIGPIADDGVALQLRRYTEKLISMRTLMGTSIYSFESACLRHACSLFA
jgi:hypothetical protein